MQGRGGGQLMWTEQSDTHEEKVHDADRAGHHGKDTAAGPAGRCYHRQRGREVWRAGLGGGREEGW